MNWTSPVDVGTGRSGSLDCNDITSVFAFLAFLFALLNFVINMGGGGRRRRGADQCWLGKEVTSDPVYRSSVRSVYALYRGVLDYMELVEEGEGQCGARVLCEAGEEAGGGQFGGVIAVLGAHRAGHMLETLRLGSHRATVRAVTEGVAGQECNLLYPCSLSLRSHSRGRGRGQGGQLDRLRYILSRHEVVES